MRHKHLYYSKYTFEIVENYILSQSDKFLEKCKQVGERIAV